MGINYKELSKLELRNLAIERSIPLAHIRTVDNLRQMLSEQDRRSKRLPKRPSSLDYWEEMKAPSREEVIKMTAKKNKVKGETAKGETVKLQNPKRTKETDLIFAEVAKRYPQFSVSGSDKEQRYTLARLKKAGGATFYMSQADDGTFKLNQLKVKEHKLLSQSGNKIKTTLTEWVKAEIAAHPVPEVKEKGE